MWISAFKELFFKSTFLTKILKEKNIFHSNQCVCLCNQLSSRNRWRPRVSFLGLRKKFQGQPQAMLFGWFIPFFASFPGIYRHHRHWHDDTLENVNFTFFFLIKQETSIVIKIFPIPLVSQGTLRYGDAWTAFLMVLKPLVAGYILWFPCPYF